MNNFYDLSSYLRLRIEALQSRNAKLEYEVDRLRTFLFEVTDSDCPVEYSDIVRKEIVKEEV
jgi:hypothetical protein